MSYERYGGQRAERHLWAGGVPDEPLTCVTVYLGIAGAHVLGRAVGVNSLQAKVLQVTRCGCR